MNDLELLREFRNVLLDEDPAPYRQPAKTPRRRRWTVLVPVGAVAVVLAVVAPAILGGGSTTHGVLRGLGAENAAAAVLQKAAHIAAQQPATAAPGPGQYVYTKTVGAFENTWADVGPNNESFSVLMPETREAWIGTDGSGRLLESTGTPSFLTDKDRAVWIAAGRPDLGGNKHSDESFPAGTPDQGGLFYFNVAQLPTDPDKLKQLIEDRKVEGGPPGNAETFAIIGDMLRETYAPPALRSALYQIVSELPGVEYVGHVTDSQGREGVAVAFPFGDNARQQLVFDPDTSTLLAERSVLTHDSQEGPAGAVIESATYLTSGVVDSTSQRP